LPPFPPPYFSTFPFLPGSFFPLSRFFSLVPSGVYPSHQAPAFFFPPPPPAFSAPLTLFFFPLQFLRIFLVSRHFFFLKPQWVPAGSFLPPPPLGRRELPLPFFYELSHPDFPVPQSRFLLRALLIPGGPGCVSFVPFPFGFEQSSFDNCALSTFFFLRFLPRVTTFSVAFLEGTSRPPAPSFFRDPFLLFFFFLFLFSFAMRPHTLVLIWNKFFSSTMTHIIRSLCFLTSLKRRVEQSVFSFPFPQEVSPPPDDIFFCPRPKNLILATFPLHLSRHPSFTPFPLHFLWVRGLKHTLSSSF